MKSKILIAILVLLVGFSLWFYVQTRAPEAEGKQVTLRVTKNATETGVIENLYDGGYIKDKLAFKLALLAAKDTTPTGKNGAITVGRGTINQEAAYTISKSMNAWDLAYVLLNRGRAFDCSHGCPEGIIWEGEETFGPMGSLKGKLTIGPLCPVEPCPSPIVNPYSDLQLTLKNGELTQYPRMDAEGNFELEVPVGKYTLTLEPCSWLGCENEFPKEVVIEENQTTNFEINLDTGIR